ncbi:MAG: tRNA preQ1(34) S-adenosylmethionine ribosyltransferase-isomerase QueA [Patescibacteria group bacterium]|nr:tRNA preQ1(34) S-adenosylmethionine ribosyltransferase-isomerase QueA [Patescibacteria group bacterium]
METIDFDYNLPKKLIAQKPIRPRDHSRLLILNKNTGGIEHRKFFEITDYLKPGDLLVVNESKVFKARLVSTDGIEIFLLRPNEDTWLALAKPAKKLRSGQELKFEDGTSANVIEKREDGTVIIDFKLLSEDVIAIADRIGQVPIPPYVDKVPNDERDYQTVYAKNIGSVAAPTAGFHFTPKLIENLKGHGIKFAAVTLHVGLGTFRPIKTETIEDHIMHEEWIDVPVETSNMILETKERGGRVIAVGTTTVRALESDTQHGFTNIFITPGYKFKTVDALITNFHLPKSSLLVLISAFAGRERIMSAYEEAVRNEYRLYSFGDAMFIQ